MSAMNTPTKDELAAFEQPDPLPEYLASSGAEEMSDVDETLAWIRSVYADAKRAGINVKISESDVVLAPSKRYRRIRMEPGGNVRAAVFPVDDMTPLKKRCQSAMAVRQGIQAHEKRAEQE